MNTNNDDSIDLPAGFRFHPTDEELITHYLSPKSLDDNFTTLAIGDADLNKVEPWNLPWKARFGEEEWYFFFERDKKYPTGLRTNRATRAGYWKATGKDKEIRRSKDLIGMKKTLVFYRGRAPRGEKTNWVMHEYRLEGERSKQNRREWVICRVFSKRSRGERVHISGLIRNRGCDEEDDHTRTTSSDSPPLTDLSSSEIEVKNQRKVLLGHHNSHGTCFSSQKVEKHDRLPQFASTFPVISESNSIFPSQNVEFAEDSSCPDSCMLQEDQSGLGILLENGDGEESIEQNHHHHQQQEDVYGQDLGFKRSWEEQVNLDCLWNY